MYGAVLRLLDVGVTRSVVRWNFYHGSNRYVRILRGPFLSSDLFPKLIPRFSLPVPGNPASLRFLKQIYEEEVKQRKRVRPEEARASTPLCIVLELCSCELLGPKGASYACSGQMHLRYSRWVVGRVAEVTANYPTRRRLISAGIEGFVSPLRFVLG